MQLTMLRHPEPYMLPIMEGLFDLLQLQHFFIEIPTPVEVRHKDGLVAEMDTLALGSHYQEQAKG